MDIVMTTTTKLPVTLMMGTVALVAILTGTNTASIVIACRPQPQLQPQPRPQLQPQLQLQLQQQLQQQQQQLQQQLVKTTKPKRNAKSGRKRENAATMVLLRIVKRLVENVE
jgi:hypothetical protein